MASFWTRGRDWKTTLTNAGKERGQMTTVGTTMESANKWLKIGAARSFHLQCGEINANPWVVDEGGFGRRACERAFF